MTAPHTTAFEGFGAGAVAWFSGLERDNSRAYFQATRPIYEAEVRDPLERLLDELAGRLGGEVKLFRQHRDVRFSADRSPYKTATYGIVHGVAAAPAVGFYAQVSAQGLYAASGCYRPAPDQLERYRSAVLLDGPGEALGATVAAVERAGLELFAPALRSAPRGVPRDHPRVALLRFKDLVAGRRLAPGPALATRAALDHVAATWEAAAPLNAWLSEHVGATTSERLGRVGRG